MKRLIDCGEDKTVHFLLIANCSRDSNDVRLSKKIYAKGGSYVERFEQYDLLIVFIRRKQFALINLHSLMHGIHYSS